MASTTFSDVTGTPIVAAWLNDVNDFIYDNVFNVKNSVYGAVGDNSTDDYAAIQAALDAAETAGGGLVIVPWPTTRYLLGTGIQIPNNTTLMVLGAPNVLSGGQPFRYTGSGAAISLKAGESDNISRGIRIQNVGVELDTAGATGFRIRRARDVLLENCTVNMDADSQIGFHYMGERSGGTYAGVFDVTTIRCRSYAGGTHTNALHYKLSGTNSDGQCNANTFFGIGCGGAGIGLEVGPSIINSFYGLEFEALTGDYIKCLANATYNRFYDLYCGDAGVGWASKIFNCESGAQFNELINYNAGANMDPQDVTLNNTNSATYIFGDSYRSTGSSRVISLAVEGEAERRMEVRGDALRYGDGATATLTPYVGPVVQTTNTLTLSASITPNLNTGHHFYLNINAATDPTINAPTNGFEGCIFTIEIINNSGGARTLTWDAAYIKNSTLTTSLASGARYTLMLKKRGSSFVIIGTPITM